MYEVQCEIPPTYCCDGKEAVEKLNSLHKAVDAALECLARKENDMKEIEELDRIDIINMLRGTTPSYSVMKDIPKELGSYCGGFVDEWKWNISAYNIEYYKEYSDEYLLELYYKCKKGERL